MKNHMFCWNELSTQDPAKAKAFYTQLFGWEAHDIPMEHASYTMFKSAECEIAGLLKTPCDDMPSHWMSYILVEDIEQKVAQVQAAGGTVVGPMTEVSGLGKLSVVTDPTGATFALWQELKKS